MKKTSLRLFVFTALFVFCSCLNAQEYKTITDMDARQVSLPKQIHSVITLGAVPVINSFVMALGEADTISNGLPSFATMPKWKYQYVFAPHLKKLEAMQDKSLNPQIEKILKAKPDLVLTMHKSLVKVLSSKNIKVVVLKWRNISDIAPMMTLLGEIFNKQAWVKNYLKYFKDTVAKAANITKNIPQDKRPKVLSTNFSSLRGPHLIAEWWIKAAGGRSVTDNGRGAERFNYSIEQLLAWNPNVIIVSSIKDKANLLADPRVQKISAVLDKKVYITPTAAHVWANRTIEQPLMVLWTLNKLYPKLYSSNELKKDVQYFYEHFFKTKLSQAQIQEIITGSNK